MSNLIPFPNGHGHNPQRKPQPMGQPGPMPISADVIKSAEPIVCEACGFDLFIPTVMLRRVSAFANPTGQEVVVNLQVHACSRCGHVNADALPPGLERPEIPDLDFGAADEEQPAP